MIAVWSVVLGIGVANNLTYDDMASTAVEFAKTMDPDAIEEEVSRFCCSEDACSCCCV